MRGANDFPDMRFSAGSMLKAEYALVCGFSKAELIQAGPSLFHRYTELYSTSQREGEAGFSCSCGKKGGKNEWR